jgi:hypothetical protein
MILIVAGIAVLLLYLKILLAPPNWAKPTWLKQAESTGSWLESYGSEFSSRRMLALTLASLVGGGIAAFALHLPIGGLLIGVGVAARVALARPSAKS